MCTRKRICVAVGCVTLVLAGCGEGTPDTPAALAATAVSTMPLPTSTLPPPTTAAGPEAPPGPYVDRVFRIDDTHGWISGPIYVAVVEDGQLRTVMSDRRVFGINPIDRDTAWAVVDSGSLSFGQLRRDGTFVAMSMLSIRQADLASVSIASSGDSIWLVADMVSGSAFSVGRLFVSNDGGNRFEERVAPAAGDVAFVARGQAVLVGGVDDPSTRGHIFATSDGGRSWHDGTVVAPAQSVERLFSPTVINSRIAVPALLRLGPGNELTLRVFVGDTDNNVWSEVARQAAPYISIVGVSADDADTMWWFRSESICRQFKADCATYWTLESVAGGKPPTLVIAGRYADI
jgi:hypothetical protein